MPVGIDGTAAPTAPGDGTSPTATPHTHGLPHEHGIDVSSVASRPNGQASHAAAAAGATGALSIQDLHLYYGTFQAVKDVSLEVPPHSVTAIIGPSGCGKSTFIRSLNRMHELVGTASVSGAVHLDGVDVYAPAVDPVELRRVIGMVFQRPNPFPTMSIFDNVVSGVRLTGRHSKAELDEIAENTLKRAALWDEVKDKLKQNSLALSGGQQQRLCIARALAVEPEVLLMDEPASALDPVATLRIEELISELRENLTIVIVTHNMQQAARVSDQTAFFTMDSDRAGYLVEVGPTTQIFTHPREKLTEDYVSGRFG